MLEYTKLSILNSNKGNDPMATTGMFDTEEFGNNPPKYVELVCKIEQVNYLSDNNLMARNEYWS